MRRNGDEDRTGTVQKSYKSGTLRLLVGGGGREEGVVS